MLNDPRWVSVHSALVEYFREHQASLPVPNQILSPDGLGWEPTTNDDGAEESDDDDWLGCYRPMSSPGLIKLRFHRLLRFSESIAAGVGGAEPLSVSQREQVFIIAAYVTYQHELFHHYCDVVRTMHRVPCSPSAKLDEEALAVAFSWHRLYQAPAILQGFSTAQIDRLVDLRFWYGKPGYRDWRNFTAWHHFLHSACNHMWGETGGTLARHGFSSAPFVMFLMNDPALTYGSVELVGVLEISELRQLWPVAPSAGQVPQPDTASTLTEAQNAWLRRHVQAPWLPNKDDGTIDVDGDVVLRGLAASSLPVRFGRIRGTFDCAGVGLTSVDELPRQVDGDLICCNNHFTSLAGISAVSRAVRGKICFHDNPLCSHVLGVANIEGGQQVALPHPEVHHIFALHRGELNDNFFSVQAELLDKGLDPFAEL